jgi:hypothetical protein
MPERLAQQIKMGAIPEFGVLDLSTKSIARRAPAHECLGVSIRARTCLADPTRIPFSTDL